LLQSSLVNIVKAFRFNRKEDFPAYVSVCIICVNENLFSECLLNVCEFHECIYVLFAGIDRIPCLCRFYECYGLSRLCKECTLELLRTLECQHKSVQELSQEFCEECAKWAHQNQS
jgi:hypothetical protein